MTNNAKQMRSSTTNYKFYKNPIWNTVKTTDVHQLILTRGFGSRVQVDLTKFQSMSDGEFNFLMNYQDRGMKVLLSKAIVWKRASCVAWELIDYVTLLGPPEILQADNRREFNGLAGASKVLPSDGFIDDIFWNKADLIWMLFGSWGSQTFWI